MGGLVFFMMYNRIGFANRLMFCLVTTQSMTYMTKANFYRSCVEELNTEMTLVGQEARILTTFYFPQHPQAEMLKEICGKYKEYSFNQKQQENARR